MLVDLGRFLAQQIRELLGAATGGAFQDAAMRLDRGGKLVGLLGRGLRQLVQLRLVAVDMSAEALRGGIGRQGHAPALLIDQL
ncbi:MAG: hypothetical protein ACREVB_10765, partial [Burkholderiales bacterium]